MATRAQILRVGLDILKKRGVASVSMRRLAVGVGVSAPALYRHFPNREAILSAMADVGYDMLGGRMEEEIASEDATERLLTLLDRYIQFAQDAPEMFDLMFRVPLANVRVFPQDFLSGKSRSGQVLVREVRNYFAGRGRSPEELAESALTIWTQTHGLAVLYQAGRIAGNIDEFKVLARHSMKRVLAGWL